ncbi:DUF502 domain-containing protein [Octadecabacter sp.]|jgi:uncharacterized membrane protein|nr:DUF502 domain-containing protein [Octadecabacter sp.]MDC1398492.1 DUF502 domain-containing protein [Octadecabacter sp.]MDG1406803.1 DUF502 domain-containing protein [Octadecabacter sp.]|tara:strand:+ start:2080 stop:2802 length:723 start_codon:yes stop_codon:yes gene_type:complete
MPRRPILTALRNNFIAGLVVIAPIGLTLWLIWTVVGWVDSFVWPFVPDAYQPEELVNRLMGRVPMDANWIEVNVRGIGVVIFLIFTMLVGWMGKGLIGRSFLRWGESLVARVPVMRSIYNAVKQIAETVFAQSDTSFDKACLIEYPRKGIWAIGFISTSTKGEVLTKANTGPMTSVFVPTTPNPTSGFLLLFPTKDVIELDMTVEDAAKFVISAGLVYPGEKDMPDSIGKLAKRITPSKD